MTASEIERDFRVIRRRPQSDKDVELLSKLAQATPDGHKIEVVELDFLHRIKLMFLRWEIPAIVLTVNRPCQSLEKGFVQQTIAFSTKDSDDRNVELYRSILDSPSELENYVASAAIVSDEQIRRVRSRRRVEPESFSHGASK